MKYQLFDTQHEKTEIFSKELTPSEVTQLNKELREKGEPFRWIPRHDDEPFYDLADELGSF